VKEVSQYKNGYLHYWMHSALLHAHSALIHSTHLQDSFLHTLDAAAVQHRLELTCE
jgi:hypothetical protein